MGEVYRARDGRLHRDVAIKVLPGAGTDSEARLQRFALEARALAALNHPNILAIHDTGEQAGQPFLVTELVEGQTLRRALEPDGTRLPVRRAVDIALQIAQALAAAHGRGILHRDLKPENVIVTGEGRVKVLDFGLARLVEPDEQRAQASTAVATNPGTALGTPGYMAPEQVRGQPVDHRADLFALGCVLYETLAGRRAFSGATGADAMSAVLKDDPPEVGSGRTDVAPALERIVQRCLEKEPAARFQGAADLAFALQTLTGSTSARPSLDGEPHARSRMVNRERVAWVTAGVGALLAATSLVSRAPSTTFVDGAAPPAIVAELSLAGARSGFVSPDGRYIAYGNTTGIWLRQLDGAEPTRILDEAGTTGVMCWSPDSRSLAINVKARMRLVAIPDGTSRDLGATSWLPTTCGWSPSGEIVFSSQLTPMRALRIADGATRELTQTKVADAIARYDFGGFLPDGRHFVFRAVGKDLSGVYVGDLVDTASPVRVAESNNAGIPSFASGHLMWTRDGSLWARPFDPSANVFTGEERALSRHSGDNNRHDFSTSVSVPPTLVVGRGAGFATRARFDVLDRRGRRSHTVEEDATSFSLSPDGATLAFGRTGGVWTTSLDRPAPVRVVGAGTTFYGGVAWSLDGRSLYYTRNAPGEQVLLQRALSVDAPESTLVSSDATTSVNSQRVQPTKAGLLLRTITRSPGASYDLMLLDASGQLTPWMQTGDNESNPALSPDGEWVAFNSDAGGEWNVYLKRLSGPEAPLRVSQAGGANGRWRRDGRELYYLTKDGVMTAVAVATTRFGVQLGGAQPLFTVDRPLWYGDGPVLYPFFDVTPDGQRFVLRVNHPNTVPAALIHNWPALLAAPRP